MPLEVVLIGPTGTPEKAASIGVEAHHRLFGRLGREFQLLSRMSEYYEDTSYSADEMEALREEVSMAESRVTADSELQRFLSEVVEVAALALQRSCGVEVLAD